MSLSPELFDVLSACDAWRNRSGGAFDPRVEVMTRLWSRAAGRGRVPEDAELAAARAHLAQPAWRIAPGPHSVERLTDCPLSLNAIAKGYIVDRACAAALVLGQQIEREFTGFLARIFQHEEDHLRGIVFLDRLESTRDIVTEREYQKLLKG